MRVPTLPSLAASRLVHLAGAAATLSLIATACVSTDRPHGGHPQPEDGIGLDTAPGDTGQDVGVPDAPSPDVDAGVPDATPTDEGPSDTGLLDAASTDTDVPSDDTGDADVPSDDTGDADVPSDVAPPSDVGGPDTADADIAGTTCTNSSECPSEGLGPCLVAQCLNGQCGPVPAPAGTLCNDDDPTTKADICLNGVCAGFAMLADGATCDTTPSQHTVATSVFGADSEWSFARVGGPAGDPGALEASLWTSPVGEPVNPQGTAVKPGKGDIFVGIRAGFAVTQTLQVFTYTPSTASGPGTSFAWSSNSDWTNALTNVATTNFGTGFAAHAMWAIRRGNEGAGLYVVVTYPTDKAGLVVCSTDGQSPQPSCWTRDLVASTGTDGELDLLAIAGVRDGDSEQVFAVVNRAKMDTSGDGITRYFVDLWVGGAKEVGWNNVLPQPNQLQLDSNHLARATGLVPLGSHSVFVLEDLGGVAEVASVDGSWSVSPVGGPDLSLSSWPPPDSPDQPVSVRYVAGRATPNAVLLVGQVKLSSPPGDTVILRWLSHASGGPVPGLPQWDTLVTSSLGSVGQPLDCTGAGCPNIGIYDAGFEPTSGAMMLVGATRPTESGCVQLLLIDRHPPAPPADPTGL